MNGKKLCCKAGHEFTKANTYRNPKSRRRSCRACMVLEANAWRRPR